MKNVFGFVILSICFSLASPAFVVAKEYNKRDHLDPGSQAKVNKVIAEAHKDNPFGINASGDAVKSGCGDVKVGNLNNSGRPPRDVIIVARDIINVSNNC